MPSQGIVYATPGELFGRETTLTDVTRLLSAIPRSAITTVLCRLGVSLDPDDYERTISDERRVLRPLLLEPGLRRHVEAFDAGQETATAGVAFCRPQVLLALRLAQRLCPEVEMPTIPQDVLWRIGSALLEISGLLVDARDAPEERPDDPGLAKKHVAAMMLGLFEGSNPPISIHSMKRTFTMATSPRWQSDRVLRRAAETFRASFGISVQEYLSFLTGLVVKFSSQQNPGAVIEVRMDEILRSAPARDGMRAALRHVSIPYAELPDRTPPPEEALRDQRFTPFRSRPLIALPGERYLCTDITFLRLLSTAGLFWTLRDLLPSPKQQGELFVAWGCLFEDYVHATLEPTIGEGRYHRSPRDDEGEITDAIIDYGADVVLLEAKAVLLQDELKYGRDLDAIVARLEERLLKDDQLVRALTRLFDRRGPRAEVRGLLRKPLVERLYPVVITYDHSVCSPFISDYLDERLREKLSKADLPRHPIVQPLTLIAADDVDLLVPLLKHGVKVPRMLKEYSALGRPDVTFHNYLFDLARAIDHPFKHGTDYARVRDESLRFWEEQGLPADTTW